MKREQRIHLGSKGHQFLKSIGVSDSQLRELKQLTAHIKTVYIPPQQRIYLGRKGHQFLKSIGISVNQRRELHQLTSHIMPACLQRELKHNPLMSVSGQV